MTVIKANETWKGRLGTSDAGGERNYSRVYLIITNSVFDTVVEAAVTPVLPALGDLFPSDSTAYCQKLKGVQEPFSPKVWTFTASFSNKRQLNVNPLLVPTEFVWGSEQFQRAYSKDRFGEAILNSAGDPYDPPVIGDDSRVSVTMSRNVASIPPWFLEVGDKLNSSSYQIDGLNLNKERAKIQRVHAGRQESSVDGILFRRISVTMHVQDKSWQKSILDAGFRELDGTGQKMMLGKDGHDVTSPTPLDGSGAQLASPSPATAVHLDFDIYDVFDFNQLPF